MATSARDLVVRFLGDTSDVEDSASGLSKTLGAAGVASGLAFAAGTVGAMNVEAANDKLAAQLGATGSYAKDLGKVAGDLYANAYGDSLDQVNEALRGVIQSGLVMEDASKAQLESVTAKVLDLSTAFDQDLGGATEAVGQLMKTGLAPNAEAALDVVTRGFQEGADRSGDFLDTLTEYSVQFEKFGLDAGTATGILVQGMDAGARNSDLVADAIKEFSIRAIDGSKLTAEGFGKIGLNAETMAGKIAQGGPVASAALDETLDALRRIEDPLLRDNAAADLFGTQAEDLGDALFALDPSEAVKGLGNVAGATERMGDALNDNATTNLESFKRQAMQAFVDVVGGQALPLLAGFIGILDTLKPVLLPVIAAIATFVGPFAAFVGLVKVIGIVTRVWAAAQLALNVAWALSPVGVVVIAIAALAAGLVVAYKNSETFRNIVDAALSAVKDAGLAMWDALKVVFDALVTAYHAVSGAATTTAAALVSAWNATRDALMAAYNAVADATMWLWNSIIQPAWSGISKAVEIAQVAIGLYIDGIKLYFTTMADVAMWLWNTIITPVWAGISLAIEGAMVLIGIYMDAVKLYFQLMGEAAMFLWNMVITPAWNGIMVVIDTARGAIDLYIQAIKFYFTAMGDTIMFVWTQVISPAFELLKTGVRTVETAFTQVVGGIERVWSTLGDIMKKPIVFFIDTVWNKGVGGAWGTIDGFLAGALPDFKHVDMKAIGLNKGGKVPGSGNGDTVPALLTPGEIVVRKQIAEPYKNFLLAFNSGQAEALQAAGGRGARGPQRFAAGGLVAGEQFARAQHGKPYIWGGVGPRGYDCSGFMSAIANVLMGRNPHSRLGTTGSAPWSGWSRGLTSAFGVGFFKGNPGHMAGTLNGFNVESGGSPSRTKFVQQAAGARHPQFRGHMSLPQVGGMFTGGEGGGGGGFIDYLGKIMGAFNPVRALIDPAINAMFPGDGPYKELAKALPNRVLDAAIDFVKEKAMSVLGVGADLFTSAVGGIAGIMGDASVRQQVAMVSSKRRWNMGRNWEALDWLIAKESSWNPRAQNPRSTAYGLYQFLDATWGSVGGHKTSDPALQAEFGNRYIAQRYGDPIGAKAFHQRHNWYENGGWVRGNGPKLIVAHGGEYVLTADEAKAVREGRVSTGGNTYILQIHDAGNTRVDLETQFKRLELMSA